MFKSLLCCIFLIGFGSCELPLTKIGTNYYYINPQTKTNWFRAYTFCRKHGLQLLTILNENEYDTIVNYLRKLDGFTEDETPKANSKRVWTSGYKTRHGWTWDSIGEPITYFNWKIGMPDNYMGSEVYLELDPYFNFQYNDANPNQLNTYMCEKRNHTLSINKLRS